MMSSPEVWHRACTSENLSAPSSQTALQMTFLGPPHATPPCWEAFDGRSGESTANLSSCCCLLCKACFLKQEMLRGGLCCFKKDVLIPAEGRCGSTEPKASSPSKKGRCSYLYTGSLCIFGQETGLYLSGARSVLLQN